MGWSGAINAWAWRKQAKIIKDKQRGVVNSQVQIEDLVSLLKKENEEYLEELKKKL